MFDSKGFDRLLVRYRMSKPLGIVVGVVFAVTVIILLSPSNSDAPSSSVDRARRLPAERIEVVRVNSGNAPKSGVPSQQVIDLYTLQAPERKALLQQVLKQQADTSPQSYFALYNLLVPEVYCNELVRIGTVHDGGKWTCSPFSAPEKCVVLSLGLNNEISFETQWQKVSNQRCRVIGVDSAKQTDDVQKRLAAINAKSIDGRISGITKAESREFKIEDIVKNENEQSVEILKIDIEGAEFSVLIEFLTKYRVAQIFIEVHGGPGKMASLLLEISKLGYWLFSYEINGAHHILCEYSFIHESVLERYGATKLARYLDVVPA